MNAEEPALAAARLLTGSWLRGEHIGDLPVGRIAASFA